MHFGRVENDVRVAEVIGSLRSGYRQAGGDHFVILFPFLVALLHPMVRYIFSYSKKQLKNDT